MTYEEIIALIEFREEAMKLGEIYPFRLFVVEDGNERTLTFHRDVKLNGTRVGVRKGSTIYEFNVRNKFDMGKFVKFARKRGLNVY